MECCFQLEFGFQTFTSTTACNSSLGLTQWPFQSGSMPLLELETLIYAKSQAGLKGRACLRLD